MGRLEETLVERERTVAAMRRRSRLKWTFGLIWTILSPRRVKCSKLENP
jgi:hypothetical protein